MRKKESPFVPAERAASSLQFSRTLSQGGMTELHQHDDAYELAVLVSGAAWCCLQNEILHMEGGNIYLLPPGVPHMMRYFDLSPHVMYHVMFRPSVLEQLRVEFGVDLQAAFARPRVFSLTEELSRRLEQARTTDASPDDPLDRAIRHMQIKCVLLTMARQLRAAEDASPITSHPQLAEALRHIQAHYAEELTLAQLSRVCGLSQAYLCRLCKQETGRTPGEYLLAARLENACRMLCEGELNVSQIALRTGFNSTAYFDRRFRLHVGMSPSEYQMRYGKGVPDDGAASK